MESLFIHTGLQQRSFSILKTRGRYYSLANIRVLSDK